MHHKTYLSNLQNTFDVQNKLNAVDIFTIKENKCLKVL